jgi:hypothetical protein
MGCQEKSKDRKNEKRIVKLNGIQEVRGSTPLSSTKGFHGVSFEG